MVATLLRLRLRLLINSLTREVWRLILTILGLLYAGGVILVLAIGAFFLGRSGADLGTPALLAGVVVTLLWVLLPLLVFGIDDTLDPARFAIFTTPTPAFGVGLILAGAVSIPGMLTLGGLIAMTLAWATSPLAAGGWILASILGFLTCLSLARLVTTVASTKLRSRRGKDLAAGVGIVLLLAVILLPNVIDGLDLTGAWQAAQPVLKVLAWTPLGASWAVPGALAAGSVGMAAAYLLVAIGWLGIILRLWTRALLPAMLMPVQAAAGRARGRADLHLAGAIHRVFRLPVPAAAGAARALRYWRADPRYFTQAITIILIAPLLAVVFSLAPETPEGLALSMPLLMAFFAGWAVHNDTAYDSTALWMTISAGVRGRDDRLGRAFAYLAWSLPALVLITTGLLAYTGAWGHAPLIYGAALGLYGAGLGFSLASSAYVVYPVQPPGTSPFSTTGMGAFGVTVLTQALAGVAIVVLALPTIITGVIALVVSPVWGYATLVVGAVTTVSCVWAGIVVGGRALDDRAPAHLLNMKGWSGH